MESRRRWGHCNGDACHRTAEATAAVDPDGIELTCVPPLPQDLEQHIRECQCSCDHLGFGNFKTITYVDGQHWDNVDVIDVKPSVSASTVDILHGERLPSAVSPCSPTEPRQRQIDKKEAAPGAEIGRRHWCVVCMILVVVAATGLISVPLLLRDMARSSPQHRLQLARKILSQVPLVDGHNDFPWNARRFVYNKLQNVNLTTDLRAVRPWNESVWSHTDLFRLRQGMVGAQFWSIYVPCGAQYLDAVQIALEQIDTVRRLVERYPSYTALAGSAQEIVEIHGRGRVASLLGVEGGHAIASSLPVLRSLHALGARYLTLTHTCSTPWSEYSEVPSLAQRGLTEIGESVIREMNRLGMLVDLSHSSTQTMRDVLAVSRAPTMFSHSSAHALCNISRNVPDAILKQLALHDGIVTVSFYNRFLTCGENATINDVVAHIEHIRRVAGVDHIGLGAGYDGIDLVPEGLEDVSSYPRLVAELLGRPGWSEADVSKVVGLNFLRVLRKVEQTRDHLSMEEPISLEPLQVIDQHYINNNCTFDLRLK